MTWNSLGIALRNLRRFEAAVIAPRNARDIFQETGNRHTEGDAWQNLGLTLLTQQQLAEARHCFREAVAAYTESGDAESSSEAQRSLELVDADEEATDS